MAAEKIANERSESTYTAAELVSASKKIFGYLPILVKAALTMGGKNEYTLTEARKTVTAYANKEVGRK